MEEKEEMMNAPEIGVEAEENKPAKMTRRELRETVFRIVFQMEFCRKEEVEELIDTYLNRFEMEPTEFMPDTKVKAKVVDAAATVRRRKKMTAEEMEEKAIREMLAKREGMDDTDKAYVRNEVMGIVAKREEIDAMIETASVDWKVARLGKAELAILRVGVYEIKFDEAIPEKVAINEAIELSKLYCDDNAHAFVNGVLSKIMHS